MEKSQPSRIVLTRLRWTLRRVEQVRVPRRDRNFNRGGLNIGPGPLPREHRCAGDGAPATAPVCPATRLPSSMRESRPISGKSTLR